MYGTKPREASASKSEIRPHRGGWQCFEAPGVQPYYTGPNARDYAVNYAKRRTAMRRGEIRILSSVGEVEERIAFDPISFAASSGDFLKSPPSL